MFGRYTRPALPSASPSGQGQPGHQAKVDAGRSETTVRAVWANPLAPDGDAVQAGTNNMPQASG